jgi:hypothetical protein
LKDNSGAKIPKGPKIKEKNLKSYKAEPSEKAKESNITQSKFSSLQNSIKSKQSATEKAFCREACDQIKRKVKSRQACKH